MNTLYAEIRNRKAQKIMKNPRMKRIAGGLAIVIIAAFSFAAQAVVPSINGSITFYGGAVLNGSIGTATEFMSYSGPVGGTDPLVLDMSQTGDYASVPGDTPVAFSPFTFSPAPTAPFTLWEFTVGGISYSLTATSVHVEVQDSHFLDIQGEGTVSITGYADTPGTWTIADTGSTPVLSFGAATVAVPEPSAITLILFLLPVGWLLVVRKSTSSRAKCAVRVRR